MPQTNRPWKTPLLVALAFFASVVLMGRWAGTFQYDTDEGLNLMKAVLVARGYSLYTPIWSDQPPLYTLILASVFKMFGPSLLAARIVTAAFAALLVGSMFDLVRRLCSTRAALAAVVLIVASAWFGRLSFSAMIGLPALALVVASFDLLSLWAMHRRWLTLIGSAVLMAAGIQTKLFALVALPAAWAFVWIGVSESSGEGASVRARLVAMGVWTAVVFACCCAMVAAFHLPMQQLLDVHQTASARREWHPVLIALRLMRRDGDLVILSLGAAAVLLFDRRRGRRAIVPMVWLACAAVVMQLHRPVWYHHSLLLIVPAAWAGAVAIDALLLLLREDRRTARVALLLLLVVAGWQSVKLVLGGRRMFVRSTHRDEKRLVNAMRSRADQTRWAVSDLPIYTFAAGLMSPPELAVISTKRREAGQLPDDLVVEVLERYRPEQVLLGRIKFGSAVADCLRDHYRVAGHYALGGENPARLYLRGPGATSTISP